MAVTRINDTDLENVRHVKDRKLLSLAVDAGGVQFVIPQGVPPMLYLDPGGAAIDALLPIEADNVDVLLTIYNSADAAEVITLKDDADAALSPAMTFTQDEVAMMHCDGTVWRGYVAVI